MKYLALVLSLSLLLPGCSQDRQTEIVEFKAQAGDSAKYWMKTKSNIKLEGLDVEQASLALLHYQIDKVDDKILKFSVVPELMQLSGNRNNFHSARPNDRQQELRQLMSAGFDITLSSKTGELISFSGKNAELWQQVVEKSGDAFVDSMKNSLNSPGFVRQIPAKVGEILPLTEVGIHATELEVVEVTDAQLTLQINSANEQTKLYGKVILNRDNGWIEKLALANVMPMEAMGMQGTARHNILMQRLNSEELTSFITDLEPLVASDYWFDMEQADQAITEYVEPTAEELFKFTQGELLDNGNTFFTKLLLTDGQITPAGEIWFKDIRASSSQQPGLEVQLMPTLPSFIFPSEDGAVLEQEFLPLGWLAKGELDKIDKITATALYQPAQLKTYSFDWSPDKTVTHQMGKLALTITPLAGTTDKFAMDIYPGGNEFLLPIFGGLKGKVQYVAPNVGPEWLTYDDKFTTSLNQSRILLNVTNDADTVTFYINELASEPAFEQKLEWNLK
ncbi:hypothetical protein L2750_07635 [Shewanella submarina]|uniref:DUF945 domain-containing protein n=1 Tax=Shewanella submarina TaxID=2016376 RepID=A0ABV7GB88_9GAMM|nr:hypothetical protein [Shewanella submarina]MCL1037022.1 hypothetical protein [Shewanella submarina]